MPNWDIFHSDRLEVERNLGIDVIRLAVSRGEITSEDLARNAGSGEPWVRLSEGPGLWALFSGKTTETEDDDRLARTEESRSLRDLMEDEDNEEESEALDTFDVDDEVLMPKPTHRSGSTLPSGIQKATTEDLDTAFPDSFDRDLDLDLRDPRHKVVLELDNGELAIEDEYDPEAEDEEAAGFTFSRSGAETVEELDLAAMVDVAFQLVLFFLVTASTVVFKTLEVPPPKPEDKKGAAQQTIGKTMTEIQESRILVEIDANGEVKIDHEKAPNDFNGLTARLREVRKATDRNGIILTAESATAHKNAVKAYDAAAEVGLSIAVAQPKAAGEKPPVPPPAPK